MCVFLAPSVSLVQQQARVIEEAATLKVGTFCGSSKPLKTHNEWEKEIDQYECLYHRYIKREFIALLIFDECHHAQTDSNHPYAKIRKISINLKSRKCPVSLA